MTDPFAHSFAPASWSADELARAFDDPPAPPLPSRSNRDRWDGVKSDPITGPAADTLLDVAEDALNEPMPDDRISIRLEHARGDSEARIKQGNIYNQHLMHLATVTIAECLEADGRFLDTILDYAWELCERTSWVIPSNLGDGTSPAKRDGLPRPDPAPEHAPIDLRNARTAYQLAEVDALVGNALPDGLRERIEYEIERRVLEPYEAREDFWWLEAANNWCSVANTSILGAAFHLLDDSQRLAELTTKAIRSINHFINGFGDDGGCVEGVGYWNFGFGYYVQLAELIDSVTNGAYSLYDPPIIEEIVKFPCRVQLGPGQVVAFGDSNEFDTINPYVAYRLGKRFDHPCLLAQGRQALRQVDESSNHHQWLTENIDVLARNLLWPVGIDAPSSPPRLAAQTDLTGIGWWIVRVDPTDPQALVVAAKDGTNAESHNHNDCGSYMLRFQGELLLGDLGQPMYSPDYFSENRYTYLGARSHGHPVPLVNGVEQASPTDRDPRNPTDDRGASTVLDRSSEAGIERFEVALTGCYPADAGIDSLHRTIEVDRSAITMTVTDSVEFESGIDSGTLTSTIVSYHPMDTSRDHLTITGETGRAQIAIGAGESIETEHLRDAIDRNTKGRFNEHNWQDVWRGSITDVAEDGHSARTSYTVSVESI